ncbi:hypothetical protein [Flavobacterium sp. JAS]|uniref:hypothetical protein n=1 Tax=Flavobacterium sp. JAS TaxID=2897329 RepID=UPI001E5A1F1B|nr:hypothetical protein [Flavobacterium sp. JAS]MCD0470544.1 hypothetical protein [Flavobacterium sp. JAS]
MDITNQIIWLFVLAIPIACISWTVTHEEIFKEPREWCVKQSKNGRTLLGRKTFYLFTCEYCFSHYVTIAFLALCNYKLFLNDYRGYILAGFSLVFLANVYMSLFALLRQAIKKEKVEIEKIESQTDIETSLDNKKV